MRQFLYVLSLAAALLPMIGTAATVSAPEKTALVLSGGGARGFAHIGALKALEELNVRVDILTATSMGAMVGGGYAAGYSADEIRAITLGVDWAKMFAPRADRPSLTWRRKADDLKGISDAEIGVSPAGVSFPSGVVPTQELDIFLARVTRPVNHVKNLSDLSIPYAAMATDLITGAKVVLSKNVTLAQAMRASMSIPGAFAPVPFGDALLVDGGLTDNLPVAEAREMGATRVIAINVGTPLFGREKLDSVVGVMGQMVNILTEQNVQASIESICPKDLLITPDLSEFTSGDFVKADAIMKAGYDAVMAVKDRLKPYRVTPEDYRAWQRKVALGLNKEAAHRVSSVRVDGLKTVNPERVVRDADLVIDESVTDERAARAARRIWADGDFRSVPFHFEPGPRNTEVLVFEPEEKSWGYSSLRFGGNVQFDTERTQNFNVILAHTWGWLNDWGAEWRNEAQFGETRRLKTEWYQPLGAASSWYLLPRLEIERTPIDVYSETPSEKHPYGRYIREQQTADVALGYEFGRVGTADVSAGWVRYKTRGDIGEDLGGYGLHAPFVGASLSVDTLDNVNFPRRGVNFTVDVRRLFHESESGSVTGNLTDTVWETSLNVPAVFDKNWSGLLSARLGEATIPGYFRLGGAFNLTGTPEGRFTGDRIAVGRLMLMRKIFPGLAEAGIAAYAGVTYEAGRAYNHTSGFSNHKSDWHHANALFVGADTWVGPMYLMLGRTYGVGDSLMFYWGRLH